MTGAFRAALTAIVLSSPVLPISPAIAQECPFDVGTVRGGTFSFASAVNASGQVVGTSGTSDGALRAYSWTQASGIQELATLGGRSSGAGSVNPSGQIAGFSEDGQGVSHAVLWPQAGAMPQDLGTLPGGAGAGPINDNGQVVISSAGGSHGAFLWTIGSTPPGTPLHTLPGSSGFIQVKALNASGQVIGQTDTAAGLRHGFSWTEAGGIVDLLSIGRGCVFGQCVHSEAIAVNAGGQIVGASNTDVGGIRHASSWTAAGGAPIDLHTLSPSADTTTSSGANAVNDNGQVVGSSGTGDFVNGTPVSHAFLWTQAGGMTDLGTLPGGAGSEATAINANGWIVGKAGTIANGRPGTHAFLWTHADGMLDLGTLPGGTNSEAMAVNTNGQILGESDLPPTPAGLVQSHAVLWSSHCRERFCGERCDRDDSTCQDSCIADFGSCPAETPHLDCVKALKACLKSCSNQHAQCLASCR